MIERQLEQGRRSKRDIYRVGDRERDRKRDTQSFRGI